jgi:hypothetical protein
MRKSEMPIKKEIIYPVFLECCQYADDTFWENIFEDLAYGKAPYGTYISKDFLCCSYRKKEFSYKIEKKDVETLYKEVYTLLTKRLGLLSQREKVKKRKVFTDLEDSIKDSRKSWNDIRKKNMKELLIELYVTRMKNKYSLSIKQARYLLSIILIALVFKVIKTDDIDYSDNRINSIEGIDFAKKQVLIERDLYNVEVSFAPHILVDKKVMSDNWEKYLESLRKIAGK